MEHHCRTRSEGRRYKLEHEKQYTHYLLSSNVVVFVEQPTDHDWIGSLGGSGTRRRCAPGQGSSRRSFASSVLTGQALLASHTRETDKEKHCVEKQALRYVFHVLGGFNGLVFIPMFWQIVPTLIQDVGRNMHWMCYTNKRAIKNAANK